MTALTEAVVKKYGSDAVLIAADKLGYPASWITSVKEVRELLNYVMEGSTK